MLTENSAPKQIVLFISSKKGACMNYGDFLGKIYSYHTFSALHFKIYFPLIFYLNSDVSGLFLMPFLKEWR